MLPMQRNQEILTLQMVLHATLLAVGGSENVCHSNLECGILIAELLTATCFLVLLLPLKFLLLCDAIIFLVALERHAI